MSPLPPDSPSSSSKETLKPSDGAAWRELLRQIHKEQLVSQLAGGVAHDFNNIIGVVLGYSELVLRKLPQDSPLRPKMESIRMVSRKATHLTRQLLTFSRSTGAMPQVIELQSYLQGLAPIMQKILTETVEVVLSPGGSGLKTEMDVGCLDQMVLGLTATLRPHLLKGGKLYVDLERIPNSEGGAFVAMKLVACPPEVSPQSIETDYVRLAIEPQRENWELAAIQELAGWVGGFVEVGKSCGDRGFRICLPGCEAAEAVVSEEGAVPLAESFHILLVEDEEPVRELAREILQEAGYTVSCASNGEDALRSLGTRRQPVDLVFTDLIMPRMGGVELVDRLRVSMPQLPVLYTSGYVPEGDFQQQVQTQQVHFIPKPYEPKELVRRVTSMLADRGSEK